MLGHDNVCARVAQQQLWDDGDTDSGGDEVEKGRVVGDLADDVRVDLGSAQDLMGRVGTAGATAVDKP